MKTFVKENKPLKILAVQEVSGKQSWGIRSTLLSLISVFKDMGQHLLSVLMEEPELRVWRKSDTCGNTWWSACDPLTGRSIHHVSEEALRVWIEQRYCQ